MSSIVIGYRQMEIQQMEVPKPSVGRFEWSLWGARDVLIAKGQILVFGERVHLAGGWQAGQEYWYVSTLGVSVPVHKFTVMCAEQVAAEEASDMLAPYSPEDAFVAPMVPEAKTLDPGDAVLGRPAVYGVVPGSSLGGKLASEAAMSLELDGRRIRRVDWYWSGEAPLSLFPSGAKVGERVELTQISNGSPGFPRVGWSKCEQAGHHGPAAT